MPPVFTGATIRFLSEIQDAYRLTVHSAELDILPSDSEVADNSYRDGSSELNNTEASFIESGGMSVDQRKMNAVGLSRLQRIFSPHELPKRTLDS